MARRVYGISSNYEDSDLHDWDPMRSDYYDPEFNSYVRGQGLKLESQLNPGERRNKGGFNLYIKNVPAKMTESALCNIFSRCGNVLSATLGKPLGKTNIGFVSYETYREAETAIREINYAPPYFMRVEFSESEMDKQIRQRKYAATYFDEANDAGKLYPNRKLGIGRGISRNVFHPRFNGVGVNPQKIHAEYYEPYAYYDGDSDSQYEEGIFHAYDGGPFEASRFIIEPVISVDDSGRRVSQGRGYFNIKREEVNFTVSRFNERFEEVRKAVGRYVMEKIPTYENEHKVQLPRNYVREKCEVCGELTSSNCVCGNQFYCSRDCQMKDWQKHRASCKIASKQEKQVVSEERSDLPHSASSLCKPSEYNFQKSNGHLIKDEKKHFYNRNDSNDKDMSCKRQIKYQNKGQDEASNYNKSNKFQIKGQDNNKGRQSCGLGKSNYYQRPTAKQESSEESEIRTHESNFNTGASSYRSVAENIKASAQQVLKTATVEPAPSLSSSCDTSNSVAINSASELSEKTSTIPNLACESLASKSLSAKKLHFTLGIPYEVVKQHTVAENECYVVKKDDLDKFSNLFDNLNQLMTDSCQSASPITLNLKCAAKYEDAWFRAKVISLEPLKIFFVDYGNEELVKDSSEIKVLPDEFRSILPFATRIYFADGELKNTIWEEGDTMKIIPISKETNRWFVKLASSSDSNVNQQSPTETATLQADINQPSAAIISEKTINASENFSATFENSVSSNKSPSNVNQEVEKNYKPKELDPNPSLFKNVDRTWKSSNIIEDITIDSLILLMVEDIVSERLVTASAACKTIPYMEELFTLLYKLANEPLDLGFRPQVGEMVCACIENNDWVRAIISSISSDGFYSVFLPDRGIKQDRIKEVKKLPGNTSSIPRLAVTFVSHEDLNGRLKVGSVYAFSLKMKNEDGFWIGKVKEVEDESGKIMSEITSGHLEAWEPEFIDDGQLKCVTFNSNSGVVISGGHDANNMYVKPVDDEFLDLYESLSQEVVAHCLTAPSLIKEPLLGDLVAAKWEKDGNYYRAQVVKKQKNGMFRVIFVDYGNVDDVKLEEMKQLSETLKVQPCCAVKIGLENVPMKPFNNSAVEYIGKLSTNEKTLIAKFEKLSSVKLVLPDNSTVNDKLCQFMVPGWVKANAEGTDPSGGLVLMKNNLPFAKPLPENEVIKLAVLNVLPFSGKNIQFLMFDPSSDVFKHVSEVLPGEIQDYMKSLPSDDRYVPRTGELCIAKFADDGLYYRAECVKATDFCASVLFIDYGNFGEVPFQDIHKMPTDFMLTPAMGLFCNVIDIPYSEELYKKLEELINLGDQYDVKILKRIHDEYEVNIPEVTDKLKKLGLL